MQNRELVNRWRLILGSFSEDTLHSSIDVAEDGNFIYREIDDLLDFLYIREYGEDRGVRREGSLDASQMIVPEWIRKIRRVFPKEVVERLENDALDRYQLAEILTDKKVLAGMQPNMNLLKNILALKDRMKGEVIETAKHIVRQVVDELSKKLENDIRQSLSGKINRSESSTLKVSKNLDFKKTVRKNLKNYDNNLKTIVPHAIYFNPRLKRFNPWNIIICVDQSGSMLESVIYSAIMASIFAKLPMIRISLVIFDTEVVDLSGYVDDPVDVLMSVQLGGGTDIGKAMGYCETLIETPSRTMMVIVTDLQDGAGYNPMYSSANRIIESGARLFIMTGMDEQSESMYDKNAAKIMAGLGAKVASVTPGSLARWISESMR
ncbi:MAG: VWA domain-containing protein [Tannerella sp.]|jgi:predicted metal-dependent peptidase|nr:VWA domain-containing protein [Tannerella sp.]